MLSTLARVRPALARATRPFASAAAPVIRETGYNFTLNDDEREIIDLAEKFTREEIIPNAPHHDRTGEFPWDIVKKAHSLGLMNTHVPPEYGGMGLSTTLGCVVAEKMAYGCTGILLAVEANGLGSMPIMLAGNDEQKKKYL